MFDQSNFIAWFLLLGMMAFMASVFMHLVKKNKNLIRLYALQSFVVGAILFGLGLLQGERGLLFVAILTLLVKTILAPIFFRRELDRLKSQFTATNYLSTPMTLVVLTALLLFSYSKVFLPLASLLPLSAGFASLSLASVFLSVFLLVNRRGIFSQMVGLLSLENSIVLFTAFAGLRYPTALEVGILFDMVVWIVIATVFLGMIHRHHGTLTATDLKHLTE